MPEPSEFTNDEVKEILREIAKLKVTLTSSQEAFNSMEDNYLNAVDKCTNLEDFKETLLEVNTRYGKLIDVLLEMRKEHEDS